jgi:hypothetical protein
MMSVVTSLGYGEERSAIPKDVLQQLDFMVGKWKEIPEGEGGAERVLVHERVWSPGKHCLIVTWRGVFEGVEVDASGIVGWNGLTNQVTEHWYLSDGTYFETCYPVDKMKENTWEGTTSWVEKGGRKVSGTCELRKGKDEFVWIAKIKDGDEEQTYRSTTRKIKE